MKSKLLLGAVLLSTIMMIPACSNTHVNPSNVVSSQSEVLGVSIESVDNVRVVEQGSQLSLTAKVYPETKSQEVIWSSSNETIATVKDGVVTGVNKGNVVIKAKSVLDPNVEGSFIVMVEAVEKVYAKPQSVEIDEIENPVCRMGGKLKLTAKILPSDAKQSLVWSSSDPTIATVSSGNVSGLSEGEVTIIARSREDETLFDEIKVKVEMSDEPLVSEEFANMEFTSHDAFMASEDDTPVKVKGVVTHVSPLDDGKVNYYIQNGTEGFYVYAQDALLHPVMVGKSYEIGGYRTTYAGLVEIKSIEHYVPLSENIEYVVNDLGDANPMDSAAMSKYQNSYVCDEAVLEAVTVKTSAYSFTAKVNNVTTTFRVEPSLVADPEFTAIGEVLSSMASGTKFKFKGIMSAYGWGKPSNQIKIVKASDLEVIL